MTEESFGSRLRRERERRQIALSSISANSKISVSLLAALERDDISRWPSGIFRRAFIRSYAKAIGLDPDDVTREFLDRFPDPADPPPPPTVVPVASKNLAPRGAALRLTLANPRTPFAPGHLLAGMRRRCTAVVFDVSVVLAIAISVFGVSGEFWTPLAIAALTYYAAGILLLGNAPGVSLCAQPAHAAAPPARLYAGIAAAAFAILSRLPRSDWTRQVWRTFRTHV